MGNITDLIWHRFLRVPHSLHVYRDSRIAKPRATLVFLHGIGNAGSTWDEVAESLPDDVNLVVIDLLGFGDSPKPSWAVYDAKTQARSVAKTLFGLGIFSKVIVVGHSMGSLVAVEFAKRYPALVSSLVLCSPPIYNVDRQSDRTSFFARDAQLRKLYELAMRRPQNLVTISRIAKQAKLLHPAFAVTAETLDSYLAALRANIINQTTPHDIVKLKQPVEIIYGTLDPFVIGENIETAVKNSSKIKATKFIGGHEIMGRYVKKVVGIISKHIEEDT